MERQRQGQRRDGGGSGPPRGPGSLIAAEGSISLAKGIKNATRYRPYLVKGANWLGDAVMSLPAMAALAKAGVPMRVLSRSGAFGVYEHLPMVGGMVLEEKGFAGRVKTIVKLLNQRYSGALLLTNSFSSALIALASLIPDRTGFSRDFRSLMLSRAVRIMPADLLVHQSFYSLRLVEALGIPAPFVRPSLAPKRPPEPAFGLGEGFKLALAPGAAYGGAKRWPAQSFAKAAKDILASRPGTAVILGGPNETGAAKAVEEALAGGPRVVNLAGQTTLTEAISVLAKCHLTLSNDSGLMHLSGALDVPVVAVFGPTDPMITAPLSRRYAILRNPVDCAPCLKRECPRGRRICLDDLEPSLASEAAGKLLSPFQTGRGALFWSDPKGVSLPKAPLPNDMRLVMVEGVKSPGDEAGAERESASEEENIAQSTAEAGKPEKTPAPPGALILPRPERGEIDWQKFIKDHKINPASSFWLGDEKESLAPAAKLGGRSILVMTERAIGKIADWRQEMVPDLTAPSALKAFEWLWAMLS
ncbi:MAG: lipopolysaccharide heptosyltransferase II [Deltaproteobacteria bacterium]|jgi:heptosyltransferase-2|nr:lipopolysaccharide heptosyltransferase II [Deltaproteobacteria bacterium]